MNILYPVHVASVSKALCSVFDHAVTAAYGWSDLDFGHGFHATKQGERYTLTLSTYLVKKFSQVSNG